MDNIRKRAITVINEARFY